MSDEAIRLYNQYKVCIDILVKLVHYEFIVVVGSLTLTVNIVAEFGNLPKLNAS